MARFCSLEPGGLLTTTWSGYPSVETMRRSVARISLGSRSPPLPECERTECERVHDEKSNSAKRRLVF
jgi:hypothetical protein